MMGYNPRLKLIAGNAICSGGVLCLITVNVEIRRPGVLSSLVREVSFSIGDS